MNAARGGVVGGSEVVAGVGGCYCSAGLRVCGFATSVAEPGGLRGRSRSLPRWFTSLPWKASASALAQAAALSVFRLCHRSSSAALLNEAPN